jgi:hypothetical protein
MVASGQITDAGRAFLAFVETPVPQTANDDQNPAANVTPTPMPAIICPVRVIDQRRRLPPSQAP